MALIQARGLYTPLTVAQAATGDSTNVVWRQTIGGPGGLVVSNVGTGSPTFTYTIQGSVDGTNFFNIPYALVGTPSTFVVSAIGPITATAVNTYLLQANQPWQFIKLNISALTTETVDASVLI